MSALLATIVSGAALVLLDVVQEPISALQLRGLATATKIALVVSVYFAWDYRVWLLAAAAVIGAFSSHMPGRYRYFSPLHGRVVGSTEKG